MTETRFNEEILPLHADMFRVAVSLLGNREEAQDVVQNAMVKLWTIKEKLEGVRSLKAYCYGMVRNACLTRISQMRSTEPVDDMTIEADRSTPHKIVEARDSLRILKKAIDTMPAEQSEVMKLSAYAGMSNSEIAELTGLSDTNVRALLSRGRKKLKILFSKI
ncbi:MAG: sigma-70 family RNA polymerase sigma factor [Paramuribaculum sp.]|nr:sigma-70 family RNA polymerase sigma factor [Paramuribaculum sp.]